MSFSTESPTITKRGLNKRTSNSYSTEEWKRHRPLITRLYFEEGRTLKEVREHLEKEFNFAPTERMYKSRLHSWGLDKKKKEHEMLDLVRQGLQSKGEDRNKVFVVRGRQVTLADALHYFNRKGIKDPATLLEPNALLETSNDPSSPEDYDPRTPISSRGDVMDASNSVDSDCDSAHNTLSVGPRSVTATSPMSKSNDFTERQLTCLQRELGIQQWQALPRFHHQSTETRDSSRTGSQQEVRYLDAIFSQAKTLYTQIFSARELSVVNTGWSATSDDALADQFYYLMYQGYGFLWTRQRDRAFEDFHQAFNMVQQLLKDEHVGFLIYILDLVIRHDNAGFEEPLMMLLQETATSSEKIFGPSHPMFLITSWLCSAEADISKSWIAENTLRKLLAFFQDSIGYFHPITVALLQTFATGLLNGKHYKESATRFHQLVDAFETMQSEISYEVCYALRNMSEAYFYAEMYQDAVQVLKIAIDRSVGLSYLEEREIHVRCLRAMAEIFNRLNQREVAIDIMQHVVDSCIEAFGAEHPFVSRARAHQKSLRDGLDDSHSAIPPVVYRLGRGGPAAKWIWTTRSSPLRLEV